MRDHVDDFCYWIHSSKYLKQSIFQSLDIQKSNLISAMFTEEISSELNDWTQWTSWTDQTSIERFIELKELKPLYRDSQCTNTRSSSFKLGIHPIQKEIETIWSEWLNCLNDEEKSNHTRQRIFEHISFTEKFEEDEVKNCYLEWMPWENVCGNLTYKETRLRLCDVEKCNPLRLREVENIQNCDENGTCNDENDNCVCKTGFDGDGFSCSDIDECFTNTHNCHINANCFNNIGSFQCICQSGFEGDGVTCHDINECSTNAHDCDVDAICSNSPGSYSCKCITGFTGDGFACFDIDECENASHTCASNADCDNIHGDYKCHCQSGFVGDGYSCLNTDKACGAMWPFGRDSSGSKSVIEYLHSNHNYQTRITDDGVVLYKVIDTAGSMNFNDARARCDQDSDDAASGDTAVSGFLSLPMPRNDAENQLYYSLVPGGLHAFLDITEVLPNTNPRSWVYRDGSQVTYFNWYRGVKNEPNTPESENHVEIGYAYQGAGWNDVGGDRTHQSKVICTYVTPPRAQIHCPWINDFED